MVHGTHAYEGRDRFGIDAGAGWEKAAFFPAPVPVMPEARQGPGQVMPPLAVIRLMSGRGSGAGHAG